MKEFFEIASVTREDLADVIPEEVANSFSDVEMERLSSKMADDYFDQMYGQSMKTKAEDIIANRK